MASWIKDFWKWLVEFKIERKTDGYELTFVNHKQLKNGAENTNSNTPHDTILSLYEKSFNLNRSFGNNNDPSRDVTTAAPNTDSTMASSTEFDQTHFNDFPTEEVPPLTHQETSMENFRYTTIPSNSIDNNYYQRTTSIQKQTTSANGRFDIDHK